MKLQRKAPGGVYVRITYRLQTPTGVRQRTSWAVKCPAREGSQIQRYRLVKKTGDNLDITEMLVAMRDDSTVVERPAAMNLHYGELEVIRES